MTNKLEEKRTRWQQHIHDWRESGLTQKAYCDSHNLKPNQFWYWQRQVRLAEGGICQENPAAMKPEQGSRSAFIPARLGAQDAQTPTGLSLEFPNGIRVHGIEHASQGTLKHLAEALL